MEIAKKQNGTALELTLNGRLDTTTAPQLEEVLKDALNDIDQLTLNFSGLEYVSSAGLRVLLATQKVMTSKGKMVLTNVCSDIMEVFDITGFADILTIEK